MNKKLIPVIGILLVLGVLGFVFFQQKKQGITPSANPEIKKAQEAVLANCKYDIDFCKYAANGMTALTRGYTMTSESTYAGKKTKSRCGNLLRRPGNTPE